jgi:two-component system CheB/CheR fusion protein
MVRAGRSVKALLRIVGVGASAGGLDALRQLVAHLPADTGAAFVVLQHLPPSQTGQLARLLAGATALPVVDVKATQRVAPNTIYVVPPYASATMQRGALVLRSRKGRTRPTMPIDVLFVSLAKVLASRAGGVVLSGSAHDGTEGLRAIREAGGHTFAQDPSTAQFDEMPRSAIAAGVAETVASPGQIGDAIGLLSRMGSANKKRAKATQAPIDRVLAQLREASGIDFTSYKRSTIERRLARRVAKHGLRSLAQYSAYLENHRDDARAVYEDLLIHVTEFFRDGPVLEKLVAALVPSLAERPSTAPVRVWVPGCSTGEEVYSLAILLIEALGPGRSIQLFGSDLSERAIETARAGLYPATIATQVGAARLARFFRRDEQGYRIQRDIRDRCVFVRHDLVSDPPISKLDLVSCRNLLIYLGSDLQKRVIPLFHFALNQPGYLVLGRGETIAGFESLFDAVDPPARIYARKPAVRESLTFPLAGQLGRQPWRRPEAVSPHADLQRDVDHVLLARYAPPCVIVDDNLDVIQFRGRTGHFLEAPSGQPQINVLRMARDALASELPLAIQRARATDATVRKENLAINDHGRAFRFHLEVVPLRSTRDLPRHYLLVFEPAAHGAPSRGRSGSTTPVLRGETARLREELAAAREYLHSLVVQHRATSEELGVANEELQSTNEELQSTNEELQTAKEELQSTNEELETVNEELQRGNSLLREANDDLINVLASVDIAIILVDTERRVRRFTPKARSVMKLIPGDVGRPIADLRPSVALPRLDEEIAAVIETLESHEAEVATSDGTTYRMQIRPYRGADHQIGGAVVTFVDVTALRAVVTDAHRADATRVAAARENDAFLDAVSHDLRTPLSAILLWGQALRELAPDDPRRLEAIDTIIESAQAEAELVDDLLELAISRTRELSVSLERVDAAPLVESAVSAARPDAVEKRVSLETDLAALPKIAADPRRFRQIAKNLISNAIKFTPPGGSVRVTLGIEAGAMELQVHDSGDGKRGLGIELALVRHLVVRQGGTIDVAGAGSGTAFTVRLPLAT